MSSATLDMVELAQRTNDHLMVTLLWNRKNDETMIVVVDEVTLQTYSKVIPATLALDAFNHPMPYLLDQLDAVQENNDNE